MKIPEGMKGIDVSALDEKHHQKDAKKSRLLLEARLLWERDPWGMALDSYAEVAVLEEELMQECLEAGVLQKFFIHAFSAIHCWIKAGNAYRAFQICRAIRERPEITPPLQEKAESLLAAMREGQRACWASLADKAA